MKKVMLLLMIFSATAIAKNVEVDVHKFSTKVACFQVYNCSMWQGEYECERSGSKMFYRDSTYKLINNLPDDYSFSVSQKCVSDISEVGGVKGYNKIPKNLENIIDEKGTEVQIVIYPTPSYFFKNL